MRKKENTAAVLALADKTFELFYRYDLAAANTGATDLSEAHILSVTPEAVKERGDQARQLMAEADKLEAAGVSHDNMMLLGIVRYAAQIRLNEEKYYWNRFEYEPYFNNILIYISYLLGMSLNEDKYAKAYVRLIGEMGRLCSEFRDKAEGQLQRGIVLNLRMTRDAIDMYRSQTIDDPERSSLYPDRSRFGDLDSDLYLEECKEQIRLFSDACSKMADYLSGEYLDRAPAEIGLSQYPGGKEYYEACVKERVTLDLTPAQLYDLAEGYRADIEKKMGEIRESMGYTCSREEFTPMIIADPAYQIKTPDEFGHALNTCVAKMQEKMPEVFATLIRTPCRAVQLPESMEAFYANGYYTPATPPVTYVGEYYYSGYRIETKNPMKTEPLGYHELIPGHHYQMTLVQEQDLPRLAKVCRTTAYSEGWGEYAAVLAGDIGLYAEPLSEYGRLEMDLYLTNFITVCTGINALNIPLDEMVDRLRPYYPDFPGDMLPKQFTRVSQSLPAFAIAYKMGSVTMQFLRKEAQERLGKLFDIREFHDALLEWGAMPLRLLEEHIRWYIEKKLNSEQ